MIARKTPERMTGLSLNPDNNPGVLDRPVWKEKACADGTDFWTL